MIVFIITIIGIIMYLAYNKGKNDTKLNEWHFVEAKRPVIGRYIENQDGQRAMYLGDDIYVDDHGNGVHVSAWRYVD